MYNKAIASSNTDIILNAVVVLFVTNLDEWIFAALEAWDENWTAHVLKKEVALQKKQITNLQKELDQLTKKNGEIAMLREALQIIQESFRAASTSPESIPQCAAVKDLSSHSVESEDSACSDTGAEIAMDTLNDDVLSTDCDTDGGATKEQDDRTLQKGS